MSIKKFFSDREILISGGTGFIGKACIEKLLRSCPDLSKIFIVVRSKKGKNIDQRLEELLNDSVFRRLRQENPQALTKLYAIEGDCGQLGYGIKREDLARLQNVSIVYNSAATVRFDEDLRTALLSNTRGSNELIKLAMGLKKLVSFVHISTVYCNPDKPEIKEEMYPPYADWRTSIRLAETYDVDTLNILSLKYSNFHPNTYTFSKSLSEQMVNDYRHELPIIIFRLSIVTSSYDEPMIGWADNLNGPIGLSTACGLGLLSTVIAVPDATFDIVPVDIATRAMAVIPYKCVTQPQKPDDNVYIINCANGNHRKLTYGSFSVSAKNAADKNPFNNALWATNPSLTTCWYNYILRLIILDLSRMILFDFVLILIKKKPFFTKIYRRLTEGNKCISFFMCRSWSIDTDNLMQLDDLVPDSELPDFSLSLLKSYDIDKYMLICTGGVREFILKDAKKPTKGAFIRSRCFKYAAILLRVYCVWLITCFLYRYVSVNYGGFSIV